MHAYLACILKLNVLSLSATFLSNKLFIKQFKCLCMHIWLHNEFDKITVSQGEFAKVTCWCLNKIMAPPWFSQTNCDLKHIYANDMPFRKGKEGQLSGHVIIYAGGSGFKPRSSHLSTLKMEFLATRLYLTKKKERKV
jgi:hypothetical protein